ncbi:hypothetical protein [Treponema sp. C6A8]|uniref:hypothetical protein n=1 Tax=Treponema sp. C6A8 TaxID=1410609 RepID=UPI000485B6FD|nr:hypothetical protein [Treponema sp. C6A8]
MKKCLFSALFLISLLFNSCSDGALDGSLASENSELETIKSRVARIEKETEWADELEKDRLFTDLTSQKENSIIITTDIEGLYPSFSDFGSLDISSLEYKFQASAEEICNTLTSFNEEKLYSYFLSNYRFNYVFFAQELRKGWKNEFGQKFPELQAEKDFKLFDRFILGQAFTSDNLIQIPARFYCNMGFVDVTLYMSTTQEKSLYKIKIVRWEKNV